MSATRSIKYTTISNCNCSYNLKFVYKATKSSENGYHKQDTELERCKSIETSWIKLVQS